MILKHKKTFVIIALLVSFLLVSCVYANDFSIKVTPNKESIKPGEEVKLKLEFDGLHNSQSGGMNLFTSAFKYDKNIFEEVEDSDFELLNSWSGLTYNKENGKMLITKLGNVQANEAVLEVKLKLKQNVEAKETKIDIQDISYGNNSDLYGEDASLVIKIESTNKTIFTIIVISIAVVGLLIGIIMGRLIVSKKIGEEKNDY